VNARAFTSTPVVITDSNDNTIDGTNYLQTKLLNGGLGSISQAITVCPKTSYTATLYGKIAAKKQTCYLQVCESVKGKCSKQTTLKTTWTAASVTFTTAKEQTAGNLKVYVECLGDDESGKNTVFLDKIQIH
jgi:hypothetical protein